MKSGDNFSHAATIFPVQDMEKSVQFYTRQLDFDLTFSWGDPVNYAVLKRGGVSIHLTSRLDDGKPSKDHCALYIFVSDVQQIFQDCTKHNVTIINNPKLRDYNMTDFDIKDPDGYIITFGNGE